MSLQNRKLIPPHKCLSPLALALLCVISIGSSQALAEDLIYYGKTGGSGDPGITSSLKNEYSKIDIRITGVPDNLWSSTTTEALPINSNKKLTVKGENTSVTIINTVQSPKIDNNGGTYAKANSSIKFSNIDSVYIASIGGKERGNHSTALTATGNNANIEISGKKSSAHWINRCKRRAKYCYQSSVIRERVLLVWQRHW